MKRVFLIVLDSFGIGNAPDAYLFGDEGANTLKSISASKYFSVPTLTKLGIGNIDGVDCVEQTDSPLASVGRLVELSMGKDTTIGHWEICGLVSPAPMPTYPCGFPPEIIEQIERECQRGVICNKPYSGTKVIEDYGEEHIKHGKLIVYTSADSVLQIAACEDIIPCEELYEYCRRVRKILTGKHAVGRVIARPFTVVDGRYVRTANRRDFSLPAQEQTLLDRLAQAGREVIAVGKISDIFATRGITKSIPTHSNAEGMQVCCEQLDADFCGLCFVNLVDFDMLYGHRQDVDGYAQAVSEFDGWLSGFIDRLSDSDTLIIVADHGCDPADDSTDHTRECVPLIVYQKSQVPKNLGTKRGFTYVSDIVSDILLD